VRWALRLPAEAEASLLRRWQAALAALQAARPLRRATVRLRDGTLSLLLHAGGGGEPQQGLFPLVSPPCALAFLLAHVRYGEARFLALRLRAPSRVALLAAPGRGALRALARRSGVHALLLRNPATSSASSRAPPWPWGAVGIQSATAGEPAARVLCEPPPAEAVLVLCGPRVLLETAEGMVEDWLQS